MSNLEFEIVKEVDNLKNKILLSNDRQVIKNYLNQIIEIAISSPPKIEGPLAGTNYYSESRKRAINLLNSDLKSIEDGSYYDFEFIYFQVATSIVLFLLTMVDGGISEIEKIIISSSKDFIINP